MSDGNIYVAALASTDATLTVSRREEQTILRTVCRANSGNYVVFGGRGVGKTTLLKRLPAVPLSEIPGEFADEPGRLTWAYSDLYDKTMLEVPAALLDRLCDPTASTGSGPAAPSEPLAAAEALMRQCAAERARGRRIVFLLDNFDAAVRDFDDDIAAAIRSIAEDHSFVLTLRERAFRLRRPMDVESDDHRFLTNLFGTVTSLNLAVMSEDEATRVFARLDEWQVSDGAAVLSDSERAEVKALSGRRARLMLACAAETLDMRRRLGVQSDPSFVASLRRILPRQPLVAAAIEACLRQVTPQEWDALLQFVMQPIGATVVELPERLIEIGLISQGVEGDFVSAPLVFDHILREAATAVPDTTGLAPRDASLFQYLYRRRGAVCPSDDILRAIWTGGSKSSLDAAVSRVRSWMRRNVPQHHIETVYGEGLKYVT